MKKLSRSLAVGTAVGTLGLVACGDSAPQPAPPAPSSAPAPAPPVAPAASEATGAPVESAVRKELAAIVRDQDTYSRARRLAALVPTLGPADVPAVKETLHDLRVDLKATDLDLLVRFWATHEPEAASRWAIKSSPLNYKTVATYAAVSQWAQMDPQKAIEIAWPWEEVPGLESIIPIAVVRGWYARGNPADLQQFLRNLNPDILGQRAIAAYIRVMIETQGSEAAKAWAESLPSVGDDGGYKQMVFSRVVDILSQLDVQAAIAWCDIHCTGPYGKNMRDTISRNWALYDGPASMAWLSTARPGTERDLAVRLTFALWTRVDTTGATGWMDEQSKDGVADWLRPVLPVYAKVLSVQRPLDAVKWAQQIEHPLERDQILVGVVRMWRLNDAAAADQWLATANLSPELVERVNSPPSREGDPFS